MEGGEVERHLVPECLEHPVTQTTQFVWRVVGARNEQVGHLEPHIGLGVEPAERLQDRSQVRQRQALIELLGERLQIDVGRVHLREEWSAGHRGDVACGDGYRLDADGPARPGHVHGVLGPDHRIIVGEGNAPAAELLGRAGDRLGSRRLAQPLHLAGFGDRPVLAELAAEVAASRAEREDAGAGEEVVERLLLDRVNAEAAAPPVRGEDHAAVAVLAYEAESPRPGLELTRARAEVTDEPVVLVRGVPPAACSRPVWLEAAGGWEGHHLCHGGGF